MSDPAAGLDMYEEAASPSIEPWQHGPALVKCSTSWCGPCKRISPTFLAYASRGELPCFEVDIDASPDFATHYDIKALPTFLLLQDGDVQGRIEGADWDQVLQMLKGRKVA